MLNEKKEYIVELKVKDMSCGHCVQSITKAIQALDAKAKVEADLATRKIKLETTVLEADVKKALSAIGFDAE
ncbi:MAG: heavy-metal-associated domain-containing protein [Saezia sp.]